MTRDDVPCNHDERFKGVLFTTNGCLACELEKMISECERLETALDITTGALEGSQGVIKELKERIELVEATREDALGYAKMYKTRVKELEEGIEKWLRGGSLEEDDCIYFKKLIEKEKPNFILNAEDNWWEKEKP